MVEERKRYINRRIGWYYKRNIKRGVIDAVGLKIGRRKGIHYKDVMVGDRNYGNQAL